MKISTNLARLLALLALPLAGQAYATCGVTPYNGVTLAAVSTTSTTSTAPTWSTTLAYGQGAKVQLNGLEYEARWWTQANAPGSATGEVWKLTVGANGIPQAWQVGQVYYGGEQTLYLGKIYAAKWWTKGSAPGGTDWTFVRSADVFSGVQLSGSYFSQGCANLQGMTVYRSTMVDIQWSVYQDSDNIIAYWKHVDVSTWKTPEQGRGLELARGTTKQGSLSYQYSTGPSYNSPQIIYSGSEIALYLCTALNECRRVVGRRPNQI